MNILKAFKITLALAILIFPLNYLSLNQVKALGITNLSVTGTNITSGASAVSTSITPTINFTLGTSLTAGQTLRLTLNGLIIANAGGLASADITAGGGCSGTVTLAGSPIANATTNPVLDISGLTCSTSAATLTVASSRLTTTSAAGNYAITITTPTDYGSFLYYIGSANQVTISAEVGNVLALSIRNSADTADLTPGSSSGSRICSLGTLEVNTTPVAGSINTCQYRLRIASNATNGFSLSYSSTSVDSTGGGYARLAASASINIPNQVGANSGDDLTVNPGYGIRLLQASGMNRGTTFGSTSTNYYTITSSSPAEVLNGSGPYTPGAAPDLTNTTLVTHGVRISPAQQSGSYSHTITYSLTGNF